MFQLAGPKRHPALARVRETTSRGDTGLDRKQNQEYNNPVWETLALRPIVPGNGSKLGVCKQAPVERCRLGPRDAMGTVCPDLDTGTVIAPRPREHCAGNCVHQHEAVHVSDYEIPVRRAHRCLVRAGDDSFARLMCEKAWHDWRGLIDGQTQCRAYTQELSCLTNVLNEGCRSSPRAMAGVQGGILGAVGTTILGGVIGGVVTANQPLGTQIQGVAIGGLVGQGVGTVLGTTIGSAAARRPTSTCCADGLPEAIRNTQEERTLFCTGERSGILPSPFGPDGSIILPPRYLNQLRTACQQLQINFPEGREVHLGDEVSFPPEALEALGPESNLGQRVFPNR